MTDFFYLIPIALALGAVGLGAFMWSLRSGQYDDLAGAAERILFNEADSPEQIVSPSKINRAPDRN
ncbi:hypothetical protein BH10PSE11_BH10PSE11_01450 [soil metagenome]